MSAQRRNVRCVLMLLHGPPTGLATSAEAAQAAPLTEKTALLAGKPVRVAREPGTSRRMHEDMEQERVLAMLRRPEGATVAQIAKATGWAKPRAAQLGNL